MLAFLRLFLKFIWRIRHTDEMRSILEVGSGQLQKLFLECDMAELKFNAKEALQMILDPAAESGIKKVLKK